MRPEVMFNESKLLYINKVAQNCNYILIQEHWLLDKQQHKLRNGVKGFYWFSNFWYG